MIKYSSNKLNNIWYLDFYTLNYICQNRKLFSNFQLKNYKFIIAEDEVI